MAHKTREWHATDTTDMVGSKHVLTVTGEFESLRSNETATLHEAHPPGINPTILILDMKVSSSDLGNDVIKWKPVKPFVKETPETKYHQVTIRHDGHEHTVSVEIIPS